MCAKGEGLPRNVDLAHMWFNLAAAQNYKDAAKKRDGQEAQITAAQVAEAQQVAREWKRKSAKKDQNRPSRSTTR